ncbi:hypothetical protein CEXT_525361 [Caerostris extrusa]|uniref:Uncharacterized protein n=1 Tax=Caerostris extrusa TaxID=172846 RepID=A0AAV4MP82_CAEEX|nr:hypothetical protein CEXT_525361 [Caerostris extrusa]
MTRGFIEGFCSYRSKTLNCCLFNDSQGGVEDVFSSLSKRRIAIDKASLVSDGKRKTMAKQQEKRWETLPTGSQDGGLQTYLLPKDIP